MELVPLLPLMMRTNRTDLVVMEVLVRNVIFREVLVREVLEGELLLFLLGLEAIAPAWPGSEATRTLDGRRCMNLKNTPIVNMLIVV